MHIAYRPWIFCLRFNYKIISLQHTRTHTSIDSHARFLFGWQHHYIIICCCCCCSSHSYPCVMYISMANIVRINYTTHKYICTYLCVAQTHSKSSLSNYYPPSFTSDAQQLIHNDTIQSIEFVIRIVENCHWNFHHIMLLQHFSRMILSTILMHFLVKDTHQNSNWLLFKAHKMWIICIACSSI